MVSEKDVGFRITPDPLGRPVPTSTQPHREQPLMRSKASACPYIPIQTA